jgi:hypothetical protein
MVRAELAIASTWCGVCHADSYTGAHLVEEDGTVFANLVEGKYPTCTTRGMSTTDIMCTESATVTVKMQ